MDNIRARGQRLGFFGSHSSAIATLSHKSDFAIDTRFVLVLEGAFITIMRLGISQEDKTQ